jgi:AcrR family transcriptional regulator
VNQDSRDRDVVIATPEQAGYLKDFDLVGLRHDAPDDEQATKNRLLVAAVKLFADRGYEASSMRELAAEVGVKAPAIYNHFDSKTQVLSTAVDYALSDFLASVLTGLEEFPKQERLFELLRRHARYKTNDVALARAQDKLVDADFMRRVLPPASYDRYTAALAGYRAIVRDLVVAAAPQSEHDPAVNLPVLVSALIEMVDRVSSWFRPDGTLSGDEIADQCVVIARRIVVS